MKTYTMEKVGSGETQYFSWFKLCKHWVKETKGLWKVTNNRTGKTCYIEKHSDNVKTSKWK